MPAVTSFCSLCRIVVISTEDGVLGACPSCAQREVEGGRVWTEFMRDRFEPHRPLKGEVFKIKIVIEKCPDGKWLAMRTVGSNLVPPRVSLAAKRDSEESARRFLGLK
jgi:hypothetical protein